MKSEFDSLKGLQQLVLDIIKVERNHSIPGIQRHENVVEHSFSLAMLCWKIFDTVHPPLNLEKILKYALVHDFSERGLVSDVNTYAGKEERARKKEREVLELEKISNEFENFKDFVESVNSYEEMNPEALFVWSVDKIQQLVLADMDDWRPYVSYGVSYEQFCIKNQEFISNGSLYAKDIFKQVFEESCKTYYDNPSSKLYLAKGNK